MSELESSEQKPKAIKIHHLRPAPGAKTVKRRVGRGEGGKGGKTAGRGTKGTKARKNRFRTEYQPVNIGDIARVFPDGGTIGVDELVNAGLVRKNELVKVLGDGDLSVKLDVTAHAFSKSATERITAAGGSANKL